MNGPRFLPCQPQRRQGMPTDWPAMLSRKFPSGQGVPLSRLPVEVDIRVACAKSKDRLSERLYRDGPEASPQQFEKKSKNKKIMSTFARKFRLVNRGNHTVHRQRRPSARFLSSVKPKEESGELKKDGTYGLNVVY